MREVIILAFSIDIEEIGEQGATRKKALLPRENPIREVLLKAVARGAGNQAVVTIDNVERARVLCARQSDEEQE